VAVEPIPRGAVFTAAQLELRNIDYAPKASYRRTAIDSIEKLIGMEARQAIPIGAMVFSDQVQPPVLVKRGELVTVASQGSGIRVRTTAKAREDGVQGQLVQLESLDTRERFEARVTGRREAAIIAITSPTVNEPTERIQTALRSSMNK
jgi:flagella basal body P-ring formation protein FlgA